MALNDAMSRVAAIAIVHETLSQAFDEVVDFDKVADGLLRMVVDVAATRDGVRAVRIGSFGEVSADLATNLSMVITELCQNAVEHGLISADGLATRGEVQIVPGVRDGRLRVEISDDGAGLPDDFDWRASPSLGLSIVNTLVVGHGRRVPAGPEPAGSRHSGCHRGPVEEEEALTDSAQSGPNTRACRAQAVRIRARAALRRSEYARVPRDA